MTDVSDELVSAVAKVVEDRLRHVEEEIPMHERNSAIRWVIEERMRQAERTAFWSRVRGSVIGWLIITVLGGIGYAVFQYATVLVSQIAHQKVISP